MYLQDVENVFDVEWVKGVKYREVFHRNEVEMSEYSLPAPRTRRCSSGSSTSTRRSASGSSSSKLPLPAYDYCLKCSHTFNNLDARGAISVTERAAYIGRVRALAHELREGLPRRRARRSGSRSCPPAQRKKAVEAARRRPRRSRGQAK